MHQSSGDSADRCVRESDFNRQLQLVDDLQQSVADISKDLQGRQDADSALHHLLKNRMADAGGCIDLFRQRMLKKGGRTAVGIPRIPSPSPNHRKNFIFMGQQKKEPPNSMVPKGAETTPTVAPTRALLLQGATGFGSWKIPKCLENGPFWDQKWVKMGQKRCSDGSRIRFEACSGPRNATG